MAFLYMDNAAKAAELIVDCATTSITLAPPIPPSSPPTTELTEMAASNAAVVAGPTSNVAVAASATSVVTVIGGTGVVVGASVLMHTVLSPVYIVRNMNKPTPRPSPHPTIIPKVQCPDAGAAMFAGYKVSNTSEDIQLLMVTLTNLPERLELFLTNSFSLPTMSEEFARNNTGSVKVGRNYILVYIEREMIIRSGGFSAGTLFGYESPALAISDDFMWQNSASGFTLPEQGSDVLLYCRDDWRTMKIASLSYGMTQEDVPHELMNFSIAIPDSSCAFYKGENIGTTDDLINSLGRHESFDMTSCTQPGFDHNALDLSFKVIEPNSKPSIQPSVSHSPSQMPTDSRSEELSFKPTLSLGPTSPPSYRPTMSSEPSVKQSPMETPSVKPIQGSTAPYVSITAPPSQNQTNGPLVSMRPSLRTSASPSVSVFPSENPNDGSTESTKPSSSSSLYPSKSLHPVSTPSIGPSVSIPPTTKLSEMPSSLIGPSSSGSLLPTVSDSPSENSSDPPTQSIEPPHRPSFYPSKSVDPASTPSIEPSRLTVIIDATIHEAKYGSH
eukprot:scaffold38691_cov36-Attheya_sp.AAC.3